MGPLRSVVEAMENVVLPPSELAERVAFPPSELAVCSLGMVSAAHVGRSVPVWRALAFACLQRMEMASLVEEFGECQLTEWQLRWLCLLLSWLACCSVRERIQRFQQCGCHWWS